MTTEYASTLYDTEHDAQMACVHDWMASTGDAEIFEALRAYWSDPVAITDELERDHRSGDWTVHGLDPDCHRSDIADALEEWEVWARQQSVAWVRDELGLTQQEMADRLHLDAGQQLISKYESGVRAPSKQVVLLAESLLG